MNKLVKKLSKTFLLLFVLMLGGLVLPTETKASLNTDYVELKVTYNVAPTLTSIAESTDPIEEQTTQTITPTGQGDDDSDDLHIYCCQDTNNTCTPTTSNTCNNDQAWSSPYSSIYARCLTYDGTDYSSTIKSTSYTVRESQGSACSVDTDCISGHCVDGVCCDSASCSTCQDCDVSGHLGTCYNVPVDSCEDKTGDCDGSGACKTTYCAAGYACSGTACADVNYCNAVVSYCSCEGDGCYNDGGNSYQCKGACDGSGNCDFADDCSGVSGFENYTRLEDLQLNNLKAE